MFAFYSFLRISQMKHVDRKDSLNSKMIILAVVVYNCTMYMFSTGQLLLANLLGVQGTSGISLSQVLLIHECSNAVSLLTNCAK